MFNVRGHGTRINTDETDFHGFEVNALPVLICSIRVNPCAISSFHGSYLILKIIMRISVANN